MMTKVGMQILRRKRTIPEAIGLAVSSWAERTVFRSDDDLSAYGLEGGQASGADVGRVLSKLSNVFAAMGASRHDRIAIWKRNGLDYFFHAYGAICMGGVAVPVNGGMPPSSLVRYLDHTGTSVLVTDAAGLDTLAGSGLDLPTCVGRILLVDAGPATFQDRPVTSLAQAFADADADFTPPEMAGDQDVLICHTSGTTGFPKGVLHTNDTIMRVVRIQTFLTLFQTVSGHDTALMAGWFNHHVSVTGMLVSLTQGLTTFCVADHDAKTILERLQADRINIMFAFPDVYARMEIEGLDGYDLDAMKLWVTTGDAMHEAHVRKFVRKGTARRRFGRPLEGSVFYELLGTSEVGSGALMKMSTVKTRKFDRCVGKPLPVGFKAKILDAEQRAVPDGQPGRLYVTGPTLFKGYWNAHDRLHGTMKDGWWWTGDVAYRGPDGSFYQLDREVDAIRTRDGVVYGLPIEEVALKHEDVAEATLIAVPDGDHSRAVLVAQPRPNATIDEDELLSHIRSSGCRGAEDVDRCEILPEGSELPRGLTGKVLKRVLRDEYEMAS